MSCTDVILGVVKHSQKGASAIVGLGMHTGVIQNILTTGDTQKSCALLKGLGAYAGHLGDLGTAGERTVLLAVLDDILGRRGVDTRNISQQGMGGGVDVHANGVHAGLYHATKSLVQTSGLHIMLILTHADALGVDLDKLCQGILQAAGDGDRRALHDVKFREFLGRQLGCRVNGSTRLADDDILGVAADLTQDTCDEHLALTGCRSVSNCHNVHTVGANEAFDHAGGLVHAGLDGGIDHSGIQHLTRGIYHGQLASVGVTGVKAQHHLALEGRGHEQMPEVIREDLDRALAGGVKEVVSDLTLNRGGDQAGIAIRHGVHDVGLGGGGHGGHDAIEEEAHHNVLGDGEGDLEELLLLTAVDGEDAVTGDLGKGLCILVVGSVNRVLLAGGTGDHRAVCQSQGADLLAELGVIRNVLGDNVHCTLQGILHGGHFSLGIDECLGRHLNGGVIGLALLQNEGGEGLESPLACHRCAGLALGAVGAVNIVHLGHGCGQINGTDELGGELSLTVNEGLDLLLALFQITQGGQALVKGTQDVIVQTSRNLFAVTGDKGDGIALVDEGNRLLHLIDREIQFFCQCFNDVHIYLLDFASTVLCLVQRADLVIREESPLTGGKAFIQRKRAKGGTVQVGDLVVPCLHHELDLVVLPFMQGDMSHAGGVFSLQR